MFVFFSVFVFLGDSLKLACDHLRGNKIKLHDSEEINPKIQS